MERNNKILVVVAHPDDEVLGCGGTIARYAREGLDVHVVILSQGVTARIEDQHDNIKKKKIKEIIGQIHSSAKKLGVKGTSVYDFPDNRFDSVALLDIVKVIEQVKEKVKPAVIYTHHRSDLNSDHRIVYNAVLIASRPVKSESTREIYSFEVPSSTEWYYPSAFMPNCFIGISSTIAKKIEAMKTYKSEAHEWPHPRSSTAIKILAQKRGSEVGLEAAEAFELIRRIKT
jgi:LmbE family N-acetylglucosaminyl deacetylase